MFDSMDTDTARISLQKRIDELERELKESRRNESLYRMLAANLPSAAVFLVDHEMRYLIAEGQALEQAGLSSEDLVGKTIWEALDRETALRYEPTYRQALSGETFQWEHQSHGREYITHGAPVCDGAGEVVAALALSYDITERKQTERALAESERLQRELARRLELDQARLAAVLRHMPVGVWITDPGGRVIGSNEVADVIWGGEAPLPDSIADYRMFAFRASGSNSQLLSKEYPLAVALQTGKPVASMELEIQRFDGSQGTVLASAAPVPDPQGGLIGAVGVYVDITERKRLEEAVRESERRFRTMADGTPVMIWVTEAGGQIEFINKAYVEFFGVTLEQIRLGSWQVLVHPEDYAGYVDTFIKSQNERRIFQAEARVRRGDGQWRWIASFGQPRFSESGEFLGMAGSSLDITERKQAEEARHQSENIYRAIGEAIPYGIWICEPDGRNIYASQSYLDLVGITQQQCSDFGWGDTLHPDDAERTIAAWKECVRTGELWDIEHRFRGTDGQYHPILARGIPVRDEQGNVICWAGINLDISRLKQVEHNLKTSEERFEVALRNSPMLVYTTDRDLRYTWIYNPPFGMEANQIVGKTDEELNEPANVAELIALKRSVLESGIGKRTEITWRYGEGTYHYDVTAEPIRDENGFIQGLTVAAVDITDKKRMEQVLLEDRIRIELQRRLLEQREQERLAIAQDIHDGPTQTLAGVLLNLDIFREGCSDAALSGELAGIEAHVRDTVQELRDIIAELRPALLQQLGLSRAMRAYAEDFHDKYPETRLIQEIENDLDRLSEDACLGLFRIYQEALSNVGRHAAATEARVRFTFHHGVAVLEIQDNGKGMEVLPDLISQTAKGHYGMAGMHERAQAVGGTLELRSDPGKGTSVKVTVPVS